MATLQSKTYTAQQDFATRPNGKQLTGDLAVIDVSYTFTGAEQAGDIVELVQAPQGIVPMPQLCAVYAEDSAAGSLQVKVGTAADDDLLSTAINALTKTAFEGYKLPALAEFAEPTTLQATLSTLTDPVAGKQVRFVFVGVIR